MFNMYKIGFAKDIHELVKGRKLKLGGIHFPAPFGEKAYSDGDVVIHAVVESLLGALGYPDLGLTFPSTNPKYKNIDSTYFLLEVKKFLKKEKFKISNIDISIELEKPKISNKLIDIKKNIAKYLGIKENLISVKANTCEGLGDIGKSRAVAAYAISLIEK